MNIKLPHPDSMLSILIWQPNQFREPWLVYDFDMRHRASAQVWSRAVLVVVRVLLLGFVAVLVVVVWVWSGCSGGGLGVVAGVCCFPNLGFPAVFSQKWKLSFRALGLFHTYLSKAPSEKITLSSELAWIIYIGSWPGFKSHWVPYQCVWHAKAAKAAEAVSTARLPKLSLVRSWRYKS